MKTVKKTNGKTSETKSQHGTKCTETSKRYKLLGIIKECRKLGVSKIKTNEFEVEFFNNENQTIVPLLNVEEIKKPNSIDKELLNDVRLSQLMIDDPFGFESEIVQAEQRRIIDEAVQD